MLHAVTPPTNISYIHIPFVLQKSSVATSLSHSKRPSQVLKNQDRRVVSLTAQDSPEHELVELTFQSSAAETPELS